jgi:hypothetical protein
MNHNNVNGIHLEISGGKSFHQRQREQKMVKALRNMNPEKVSRVKYSVYVHKPASYNDYHKERSHIIEIELNLGEFQQPEDVSFSDKKRRFSSFYAYHIDHIESALGMKFKFYALVIHEYEGNKQPSIVISFEKNVRV